MNDITNEITQIIDKNLPNQVGQVLKDRLNQAEADKASLETCTADLKQLMKDFERAREEIRELRTQAHKAGDLHLLELELEKDGRNLDLKIAAIKLEEAEKSRNNTLEIVKLAFRSPVYTKNVNATVPIKGEHDCMLMGNEYRTETTSEE